MKLNSVLRNLACLALFAALISCQDHQLVPGSQQRFRLKKTVSSNSLFPDFTTLYSYNSAGKLISYVSSASDRKTVSTTLQYDNQNRLASIEETTIGVVVGLSIQNVVTGRATYEYDGSGNIVSITKYTDDPNQPIGNLAVKEITSLEYGLNKLPSKATTVVNGVINRQALYTYSNGNVVKIDFPDLANGIQLPGSTTYLYDDKPNPYYGLATFRQDLSSLINTINRNNFYLEPLNDQLTYDNNGLLIKRSGSRLMAQITFEYDLY